MRNSATWRGLIVTVVLAFGIILPISVHAQSAPVITSTPPTTIIAGQIYTYKITASDQDNDPLTYSFTVNPEGMVLSSDTITWQPTKVGSANVVVQATDQKGGYSSQAWQVAVSAGQVSSIVILPNDRPTVINLGDSHQFSAAAFDAYNNSLPSTGLIWTTTDGLGTMSSNGFFVSNKAGTGTISAQIGDLKSTVEISVKDIRTSLVTLSNTNTNTTNTNQQNSIVKNTNSAKTNTAGNSTNTNQQISPNTNANTNASTDENQTNQSCTNMKNWIIILILVLYPILLAIYYQYEKRHTSGGWWLFPFFLTVVGLIIYYKYICSGTYLWWPWVLVGLGIIITWWVKGRKDSGDLGDQEKLPF